MTNPFKGWNQGSNPFAGWEAPDLPEMAPPPASPGIFSRAGLADFGRGVLGATAELGQIAKFGLDELARPGSRTGEVAKGLVEGEGLGAFGKDEADPLDAALTRAVAAGERGRHGLRGKALETFGTGWGGIAAATLAGSSVDIIDPTAVAPVGKLGRAGRVAAKAADAAGAAAEAAKAKRIAESTVDLVRVQQETKALKSVADRDATALAERARHVAKQQEMFPQLRLEEPSIPDEVLGAAKAELGSGATEDVAGPAARAWLAKKVEDVGFDEGVKRTNEWRTPPAIRDTEVGTTITQPEGYKGAPKGLAANMADWFKSRGDYFRGGARSGAEVRKFFDFFLGKKSGSGRSQIISSRQVGRRFANPEQQEFFAEALPKLYEGREHRLSARAKELSQVTQRLRRSVRQYAKANGLDPADVQGMLTERRKAGVLHTVPDELREAALEAGTFWDNLSDEIVESGMLTDELKETFKKNRGTYYMNAYAVHDDPRWAERVSDSAAWDDMYELMRQRDPSLTDEQLTGRMHRYLDQHARGGESGVQAGGDVSKDLGYLRRRKLGDRPGDEIVQQFLGLKYQFADTFEESASRMIYDLEVDRWMKEVRQQGLEAGVFAEDVVGDYTRNALGNLDGPAPGSAPGPAASRTKSPLSDVYTPPEVAELFDLMANEGVRDQGGFLVSLNSLAKANKLITSSGTHLRNFASGVTWSMNQGLGWMPLKNLIKHGPRSALSVAENVGLRGLAERAADASPAFSRAYRAAGRGLRKVGLDPADIQRETVELTELGVRQGGSYSGELGQYQSLIGNTLRRWEAGAAVADSPVGKAGGALNQFAKNLYAETDTFWKEQVWRGLKETYTDLGVGSDEMVNAAVRRVFGTDNVDELAAGVVMDTMQTYERTAPIAKLASRNPLVGTYTSFPMEWVRNTVNNVHTAAREAQVAAQLPGALKAKWLARSVSRIGGQATSLGAFSAIAAKSAYEMGWTKEKDGAWRRSAAAEWHRNSTVQPISQDGLDLTVRVADQVDPAAIGRNLLTALTNTEGDWAARLGALAGELENQFLGPEIGAQALFELMTGQKVFGNVSDIASGKGMRPQGGGAGERLARFGRAVGPTGLSDMEMMARERELFGLSPFVGSKELHEGDTKKKMTGVFRTDTVNLGQQLEYRRKRTAGRLSDMGGSFSRAARKARHPEELLAALESTEEQWDSIQEEAINTIQDMTTLGVPRSMIWEEFKGTVNQDLLSLWMEGRGITYEQYRPESYDFNSVMRKLGRDVRKEKSPVEKMRMMQ